jgi:hypothetical protein
LIHDCYRIQLSQSRFAWGDPMDSFEVAVEVAEIGIAAFKSYLLY